MIQALWTAASGLIAQQSRVDAISNNIANVNTTGFKRDEASFADLVYARLRPEDRETYLGALVPAGVDRGSGVRVNSIRKQYGQGNLESTGRELDLAIQGDGFFSVRLADGTTGYTRAGEFRLDTAGTVVDAAGNALLVGTTALKIPDGATDLSVGEDGTVSVTDVAGAQVQLGQIGLTRFADPSALQPVGNNALAATAAAGQPQAVGPQEETVVVQGALERSNVDVAKEMVSLILAQRAYEISSRAVQTADQMLSIANNLRR